MDWAALADFQLAHSPALRRTVRRTQWLAVVTVVVLASAVGLLTRSVPFVLVALLAGGVASLGIPRTVQTQMRRQVHAMFAESFPGGSNTETRLELRPDGLATESAQGTGVIAWTAFTALDESVHHIYLGLGTSSGFVIPKERITEGDVEVFAADLRHRLAALAR